MRTVTFARYFVPSTTPPGRIVKSRYAMTPETAASLGATGMVPGSQEVRQVAETAEERGARHHTTQGMGPPK